MTMLVEIWSDIVCPWCYIGKRRFESAVARFEHADAVEVRWRSFELDPHAPFRRDGNMAEHLAAKYGMTVTEAEERLESLNRMAADEGLDYDLARTKGGNTFAAHRLLHLAYEKDSDTGAAVKEALLRAYFVDLLPVSEPEVLTEIGVAAGLDRAEVAQLLESDRFAGEVRRDEAEAAALGCTGVPFFVFDRAFAVPGAQDADTFLATLRRAWQRSHPAMEKVGVAQAGICMDDSCSI
jgi:predicted DsbA family dithiol-disulfide isomerase